MIYGKVVFVFFSIDYVLMKIFLILVYFFVVSYKFCVRFCVRFVCGNRMDLKFLVFNDEMSVFILSIKRVVNRYMNCLIYVSIY